MAAICVAEPRPMAEECLRNIGIGRNAEDALKAAGIGNDGCLLIGADAGEGFFALGSEIRPECCF